jgi:broad specificity phosphatase PhoE
MPLIYYISHPDVVKSPDVPVPRWPLSARGRERMTAMLARPWVSSVGAVYCSAEQKALDGAAILAGHLGLTPVVVPELGEVDRSSTGYLPEEEHAAAARLLFERPDESVRGWETARHAQARIVRAIEGVLQYAGEQGGRGGQVVETEFLGRNSVSKRPPAQDIAIVAHGAVGTFYLCHLKSVPISMDEAQPGRDGGHYYCFDAPTRRLLHGWTRIEPAHLPLEE